MRALRYRIIIADWIQTRRDQRGPNNKTNVPLRVNTLNLAYGDQMPGGPIAVMEYVWAVQNDRGSNDLAFDGQWKTLLACPPKTNWSHVSLMHAERRKVSRLEACSADHQHIVQFCQDFGFSVYVLQVPDLDHDHTNRAYT